MPHVLGSILVPYKSYTFGTHAYNTTPRTLIPLLILSLPASLLHDHYFIAIVIGLDD